MTTAVSPVRRTDPATLQGAPAGSLEAASPCCDHRSTSDVPVPDTRRAHADVLLARLGEMAPGDTRRVAARARVIEWYLPMSVYLARRYGGRGEPMADLAQVAAIGLIKAIDRYDQTRGVPFASYAIPTIVGEIKRYFRDTGWTVRAPRRLQELGRQLASAVEELAQVLHRSPTTAELAIRLGVSRDDVTEAQQCANAHRPRSFEQPAPGTDNLLLIDALGGPDPGLDAVERRETLRRGLAALPARERRIIALRFVGDMTQAQIAARIGVSQMHVSRLLTHSPARLRDGVHDDDDGAPRAGRKPHHAASTGHAAARRPDLRAGPRLHRVVSGDGG